jgi:DNA polymerase (family 10)
MTGCRQIRFPRRRPPWLARSTVNKRDIADVLAEIGTLLELQGENPFKVRAYHNGARVLETLTEPLETLLAEDRLRGIKGIGEALAEKIATLHATGRLPLHEQLVAATPAGLREMLEVPGLGPKKVRALHEQLGVSDLAALAAACREGRVAGLAGFGEKTQEKILAGIANREAYARRHLWWDAAAVAEPILAGLRAVPGVVRAEHAGSLRRGLETVGDLDFIVASDEAAPAMDWFCARPGIKEVTGRGETKASVRFESGLQADLRVVPPSQFVFALHHFTGSKNHNVQLRQRALARGLTLSEWGLEPVAGREPPAAAPDAIGTEEDLFGALGLHFVPPELRDGAGEIAAAESGPLPELVRLEEVRGVFHNHTDASDGRHTLEEMAAAAAARGWEYLGIADHSQASWQAHGLDEARLRAQLAAIRRFNASGRAPLHVFAGVECDILPDGRLDVPEDLRAELDYVVVSVHSAFTQSEEEMTARIVRALAQPHVTMLGHATGRLLLRREGYRVDVERVVDAAAAHGVVIELNAHPNRLDLDWRHWRRAAERGVLCSINPDAHDAADFDYVRTGVNAARKGWLTAAQVLNTRPLAEVRRWLKARHA